MFTPTPEKRCAVLLAALEDFPKPPRGYSLMRPDWWDEQLQDFWEDALDWYDNRRHEALLLSANLGPQLQREGGADGHK
jgi:hypothetical protein